MTDEQTTERKKPGPKPAIQVTTRKNDALMRRLSGSNPFATGTKALPLKEPGRWHTRIENDYADDGQVYRAVHELGWLPLEPGDLACRPEDVGLRVNEAGYLVRGSQGREVVLKMAMEDYRLLEQAKTRANNATIGRPDKIKAAMANAAAAMHGDQAGEFVHNHVHGTVTDTVERLPQ